MPEPIDPMVEWLAAINGVTPQEYLDNQAAENARLAAEDATARRSNAETRARGGDLSAFDDIRELDRAADEGRWNSFMGEQAQQGQGFYDALTPHAQGFNNAIGANQGVRNTALTNQTNAFNQATGSNRAQLTGLRGSAQNANTQNNALISGLGQQYQQNNAADQGTLGRLTGVANSMGMLSPEAYHQNISSNPADVARQQASYDQLGGWASGANSISSDAGLVGQQQGVVSQFGNWASGANDIYSDAGLVGQQQGVVDQFGNWASGANDVSSDAGLVGQQQDVYGGFMDYASGANAISSDAGLVGMQQGVFDDYGQFASGGMDLESEAATAQADAEALAAQKEALGEFRERMDPRQTDAERFMYMQSRLAQEQSQRAARDANYRELERRGMGGSTMALSNLNASSAEASNTRALQDLGANAKAVDRAEKALVNYGNMSSTIADQSFERDFATKSAADKMAITNNQQRLAGIQGQGQMSTEMRRADDEMRQFNSAQQMQGLQGAGQMANTMRGQDDAMRNANADRRLTGTQGQGQMLNSMRASDDAMRMGNRDARLAGTQGMGSMLNTMRGQDDAMRMGNRDAMLQGAIQQGNMATDMRTANDAISMFNSEQTNVQARHRDDFNAGQQRDMWEREAGLADAGFRTTENSDRRADSYTGRAQHGIDMGFERDDRVAGRTIESNRDFVEGYDRLTGRTNEGLRDEGVDRGRAGEFALGQTGVAQTAQAGINDTQREILRGKSEDRRADEAVNQVYVDSEYQRKYDEENPGPWE